CFFFQAEDGIRDDLVTGVQTCALPIYHGGERGGLAAARGPRHQRYAAPLLADLVKDFGHEQLVERPNLGGDDAQYHSHVAALLEDVHAEAAEARYAVRHVELSLLLELVLLAVRHHA